MLQEENDRNLIRLHLSESSVEEFRRQGWLVHRVCNGDDHAGMWINAAPGLARYFDLEFAFTEKETKQAVSNGCVYVLSRRKLP